MKTKTLTTLRKNESVELHLKPEFENQFFIVGGFDYYNDELRIVYPPQYEGKNIHVAYRDASGHERSGDITLDGGGEKIILNTDESELSTYGFIEISSKEEIFAQLEVRTYELHK